MSDASNSVPESYVAADRRAARPRQGAEAFSRRRAGRRRARPEAARRAAEGHLSDRLAAPIFNPARFERDQMTDLAWLTVAEGAALLRAKKLSPVEWTKALLDRIAAIDEHYNAFLVVTADKALAQAKAAEAEIAKGQ